MDRLAAQAKWDPIPEQRVLQSVCIGILVLGACIIGINTRLIFSLASLWPANALLLSLLILKPQANLPLTWLAAAAGYMAADLLSGSDPILSAVLNGANLAGVATGVLAARLCPPETLALRRPRDAMSIILIMATAALGAGLAGAVVGPLAFDMDWAASFELWFSTEFVNFAIFLPLAVIVAMPDRGPMRLFARNPDIVWRQCAALTTLVASIGVMHWSGGPGAIAFTIPALLWCAVRFRPVVAATLNLATAVWLLIAGPGGLIPYRFDLSEAADISSYRMGVAMIAIGPFALAVLNTAWRAARAALEYAATRDALTGLYNRGAFLDRACDAFAMRGPHEDFCVLMIDIDHFKAVNDNHGHAAGDAVIAALGRMLVGNVRDDDISGRIGGEEFAIVLPGSAAMSGEIAAERIRHNASRLKITAGDGTTLSVTVSIGVAARVEGDDLGSLMSAADDALYAAKHGGRNCVRVADRRGAGVNAQIAAARAL